jgi:GNAT superfamily N-acetyltransferase
VLGEAVEEYEERLSEILGLMAEKHPTEPHYYLFLLGTRLEWQGRGLGSSLMAPVLEACDRNRVPAYLEATSERNKQLYLRHGFEVTDEIPLPDGPMMWPMWRSPCLRSGQRAHPPSQSAPSPWMRERGPSLG